MIPERKLRLGAAKPSAQDTGKLRTARFAVVRNRYGALRPERRAEGPERQRAPGTAGSGGPASPSSLPSSVHRRRPECSPGGAGTLRSPTRPARRLSNAPCGSWRYHRDPGPADRWRAGDAVPGDPVPGAGPGQVSAPCQVPCGLAARSGPVWRSGLGWSGEEHDQSPPVPCVTVCKNASHQHNAGRRPGVLGAQPDAHTQRVHVLGLPALRSTGGSLSGQRVPPGWGGP